MLTDLQRPKKMAYIPRWRGEADVVAGGKVCGSPGEYTRGLYLFVFEGNGDNSSTNLEIGSRTG